MIYIKKYESVSEDKDITLQYLQIIDDCLVYIKDDMFKYSTNIHYTKKHNVTRWVNERTLVVSICKRNQNEFNTKDVLPYLKDLESHLKAIGLKLKETTYVIGHTKSVQIGSLKFIGDVDSIVVSFI